jgi:hypothetical protein
MASRKRTTALTVVVLVVGACSSGPGSASPSSGAGSTMSAAPSPSAVASAEPTLPPPTPTPTAAPSAATVPTTFTSATYGYSLTVPAGWKAIQATAAWDGVSALSHDSAETDEFVESYPRSAWANAAPTKGALADVVKQTISDNVKYHGDTCPAAPEAKVPIKIGGEQGMLLEWNCGILINIAVTVHDNVAYLFGFRDLGVHAATDPADQAALQGLLDSVQFP